MMMIRKLVINERVCVCVCSFVFVFVFVFVVVCAFYVCIFGVCVYGFNNHGIQHTITSDLPACFLSVLACNLPNLTNK